MIPNGFIEVTALVDGKRFLIRGDSIDAVYENDESRKDYGVKPAHTTIVYGSCDIDVQESYDDVVNMLWNSEL